MPGYNSPRWGTVRNLPKFLCCSMYCLFRVFLCIVCAKMCTILLPPGGNPIAVDKYICIYATYSSSFTFLSDASCNVLQRTAFVSVYPAGYRFSK